MMDSRQSMHCDCQRSNEMHRKHTRILENYVRVCDGKTKYSSVRDQKLLPTKRPDLYSISFYLFQRLDKNWIYLQEEELL